MTDMILHINNRCINKQNLILELHKVTDVQKNAILDGVTMSTPPSLELQDAPNYTSRFCLPPNDCTNLTTDNHIKSSLVRSIFYSAKSIERLGLTLPFRPGTDKPIVQRDDATAFQSPVGAILDSTVISTLNKGLKCLVIRSALTSATVQRYCWVLSVRTPSTHLLDLYAH